MGGLDGDINYTKTFKIADNDLYLLWEDNRASKKVFGTRVQNLEVDNLNGNNHL